MVALLQRAQQGWQAFRAGLAGSAPPPPGLHAFELAPAGGKRRLHLRIDDDGAGVLFVDVSDVIHLNQTAAEMAYLALSGVPRAQAAAALSRRVGAGDRARQAQDLADVYAMIDAFRQPGDDCPTCAVPTLRRAAPFSQPAGAPYKADLAITYGCNNACNHCYNEPDRFTLPSLPAADWFVILDRLAAVGVPHVIFTGGEPTLHPDLPALIRHADGRGQIVGMNTNGRRLSDLAYLAALEAAGLNHVQITLGSSRAAVHDAIMGARAFRQTVRGIENGVASGVHTITNTTLMRRNQDHVEEIIDFLHDLGIRTFAMNGMIYSGGGFADPNAIPEAEMPPLLRRVRDHAADKGMRFLWYTPTEYCRLSPIELDIGVKRCNAGEYSICIEPNGDVLPCQSYYVAAGNLLRDPWAQIWRSDLFRSFRDRELDPAAAGLPQKCWECPELSVCGGGCRIAREAAQGQRTSGSACAGCGSGRSHSSQPKTGFVALEQLAVQGRSAAPEPVEGGLRKTQER
ncbi:MAG: radical SAM protein, partial [Anaerolineales bacterium]|nr:radical SAM protein [Anaerolineales bacterium]